jgi:hypothetical protein
MRAALLRAIARDIGNLWLYSDVLVAAHEVISLAPDVASTLATGRCGDCCENSLRASPSLRLCKLAAPVADPAPLSYKV